MNVLVVIIALIAYLAIRTEIKDRSERKKYCDPLTKEAIGENEKKYAPGLRYKLTFSFQNGKGAIEKEVIEYTRFNPEKDKLYKAYIKVDTSRIKKSYYSRKRGSKEEVLYCFIPRLVATDGTTVFNRVDEKLYACTRKTHEIRTDTTGKLGTKNSKYDMETAGSYITYIPFREVVSQCQLPQGNYMTANKLKTEYNYDYYFNRVFNVDINDTPVDLSNPSELEEFNNYLAKYNSSEEIRKLRDRIGDYVRDAIDAARKLKREDSSESISMEQSTNSSSTGSTMENTAYDLAVNEYRRERALKEMAYDMDRLEKMGYTHSSGYINASYKNVLDDRFNNVHNDVAPLSA